MAPVISDCRDSTPLLQFLHLIRHDNQNIALIPNDSSGTTGFPQLFPAFPPIFEIFPVQAHHL